MANSHYAGLIIWRKGEDGFEYLVIEYTPVVYDPEATTQIKLPGGTNNDHPHEELFGEHGTVCREGEEEAGLRIPSDLSMKDVAFSREAGPDHTKFFVMVPFERCSRDIRTETKRDDGDILSPPFWRTAAELLVKVEDGGLFWTHREPLKKAEALLRLTQ